MRHLLRPTAGAISALFLLIFTVKADVEKTISTAETEASAVAAVPATSDGGEVARSFRSLFKVSASIREEYDDNIYTSKNNKKSQFKTNVSPSILFNYPMEQTTFSARYTFGAMIYPDRDGEWADFSHDFLARLTHSFSSRLKIDVREQFRYSEEPNIFQGGTTLRRNGSYFNNNFSLEGAVQWTPKFGTVTTYENAYFDYLNRAVSLAEDRVENGVTHDFRFLVLPTTTFVAGGTVRSINYFDSFRDSNSFTGYVGADHSLSPTLVIGGRVGATYMELLNGGGGNTSPYGSAYVSWQTGARSSVDASYTHQVSTTDAFTYYGQESDNFTLGARYEWTKRFSTRAQVIYTLGSYETGLGTTGLEFEENVLGFSPSAAYKLNEYLDLEGGYTYTTVISDINSREYTRNQVFIGLRGSY